MRFWSDTDFHYGILHLRLADSCAGITMVRDDTKLMARATSTAGAAYGIKPLLMQCLQVRHCRSQFVGCHCQDYISLRIWLRLGGNWTYFSHNMFALTPYWFFSFSVSSIDITENLKGAFSGHQRIIRSCTLTYFRKLALQTWLRVGNKQRFSLNWSWWHSQFFQTQKMLIPFPNPNDCHSLTQLRPNSFNIWNRHRKQSASVFRVNLSIEAIWTGSFSRCELCVR